MTLTTPIAPREAPPAIEMRRVAQIVSVSGSQAVALLDRIGAGKQPVVRVEIGDAVIVRRPTP